jgi:hypothetical protein
MRSTAPFTLHLALAGAVLFTIAGFVASSLAVPMLITGVVLGAFTLLMNLRWSSHELWSFDRRERRKR